MNFSDTVVILAAGRGTRMGNETPKVLLPVRGRPLLAHVIDFWKSKGAKRFAFVLGYKALDVSCAITQMLRGYEWEQVLQDEPKGIAHALLQAEKILPERFIVQLGDCLNIGEFEIPDNIKFGIGILENQYLKVQRQGYEAYVEQGKVYRVDEKPAVIMSGIGTYFLDKKVFAYIRKTPASALRNEVEITDVIQNMINHNEPISAVFFKGDYLNVTVPRDILIVERIINEHLIKTQAV